MVRSLLPPLEIKFRGLDADEHVADAVYLGESLTGTGRLYNSVAQAFFVGDSRRRPKDQQIRIQVGPPRPGTLTYLIYFLLVHGTLPMYPQALCDMADLIIPQFIKAIFSRKTGDNRQMDKALEIIEQAMADNHEITKMILQKDAAHEAALLELVDGLTSQNSSALAEIAAPVGRTVKQVEHFARTSDPYVIDEPVAEAFRARAEAEVGEPEKLRGVLYAVDKETGTCKLRRPDTKKSVRCKITDPALLVPNNIYTDTFNKEIPVEVTGKPVMKNGKVSTFYISDGRRLER